MTLRKSIFFLLVSVLLSAGCDKPDAVEPAPPFVETEAQSIVFTSAEAIYYGDDGNTGVSDMWNIRLYGDGQMMQLSCNTLLHSEMDAEDLEGVYEAPSADGDYSPGTYSPGYMISIELPDETIEGPALSWFGTLDSNGSDYIPELLREGFAYVDINADGTFTIHGTMVGHSFLKRNFTFTGEMEAIDMSSLPETKSSNDSINEITREMLSGNMPSAFGLYKAGFRCRQ
jgi:hypothetical protein